MSSSSGNTGHDLPLHEVESISRLSPAAKQKLINQWRQEAENTGDRTLANKADAVEEMLKGEAVYRMADRLESGDLNPQKDPSKWHDYMEATNAVDWQKRDDLAQGQSPGKGEASFVDQHGRRVNPARVR